MSATPGHDDPGWDAFVTTMLAVGPSHERRSRYGDKPALFIEAAKSPTSKRPESLTCGSPGRAGRKPETSTAMILPSAMIPPGGTGSNCVCTRWPTSAASPGCWS